MSLSKIASLRLFNQKLAGSNFKNPVELVKWMGAVQAQDYAGAKWAVGQRMLNGTEAKLEKAMADGSILRTHVLRPTWHFVAPEDIRWMLALTGPRLYPQCATYYKRLELNTSIFNNCNEILAKALSGGKQLMRQEINSILNQAGIVTNDLRLIHLLMHAEIDQVITSGGRKGKQFTYALLDDRAPNSKPMPREEALIKLALRYFTSHGPATMQDFTWWANQTLADSKNALESVKQHFISEIVEGNTYWMTENKAIEKEKTSSVYLLPAFDEYTVAYKDRSTALDTAHIQHTSFGLKPIIVIDGRIAGTWKTIVKRNTVNIETHPLIPLNKAQLKAIDKAKKRYVEFLGK